MPLPDTQQGQQRRVAQQSGQSGANYSQYRQMMNARLTEVQNRSWKTRWGYGQAPPDVMKPYQLPGPYQATRQEVQAPPKFQVGTATDYQDRMAQWQQTIYPSQFDVNFQPVKGNQAPGPNGETLPAGAIAWDKNGDPYFGGSVIMDWVKKLLTAISPTPEQMEQPFGPHFFDMPKIPAADLNPGQLEPVKQAEYAIKKPVEDAQLPTLASAFSTYQQNLQQNSAPGNAGNVLAAALTDVAIFQQLLNKAGNIGTPGGTTSPIGTAARYVGVGTQALLNLFQAPAIATEKAIGAAYGLARGYDPVHAGDILYTGIANPLAYNEYMRKVAGGGNPYLLSKEYENPIAEAVGQLILDPTWAVGWAMKGLRNAKWLGKAADYALDVSPEIARAMKVAGDAGSDVKAWNAIDEMTRAQLLATQSLRVGKAEVKLDNIAKVTGLMDYDMRAVRHTWMHNLGTYFDTLVGSQPDKGEAFTALINLASDNPDDVATGFSQAMKMVAPRTFLSEQANDAGVFLRKMLADEDGVVDAEKFLKGLTEAGKDNDVGKVIEFVDKRLNTVLNDLAPDVLTQVKNGRNVSPVVKAAANFHKQAQKIVGPINGFFAGVYFSTPAFAARNFQNNLVTMAADYGPRILFNRWSTKGAADHVLKLLKGVTPRSMEGYGGISGGLDMLGTERMAKLKITGQALSEVAEKNAAARVSDVVITDTMNKMMKPGRGLPTIDELINAGLDKSAAKTLLHDFKANYYDVEAVQAAFENNLANEFVDSLDNLGFLDDATLKDLDTFGFDDGLQAVIQDVRKGGGTKEDVTSAVQDFFAQARTKAQEVAKETAAIDKDAAGAELIPALDDAIKKGEMTVEESQTITHYTTANHVANETYHDAVSQMWRVDPTNEIWKNPAYQDLVDQKLGRAVKEETRQKLDMVLRLRDDAYQAKDFNPAQAWRQAGLPEMPAAPTTRDFVDALWRDYFSFVRPKWTAYRDDYAAKAEQLLVELGQPGNDQAFNLARRALAEAQQADTWLAKGEYQHVLDTAIRNKQWGNAVRVLAHKYGIESQAESGAKLDDMLLNYVNSNLPEGMPKYAKIDDIQDIGAADRALGLHALKGAKGAEPVAPEAAKAEQAAFDLTPDWAKTTPAMTEAETKISKLKADWETKSIDLLPGPVKNAVQRKAGEMEMQLNAAEAGKRIPNAGGTGETLAISSGFPDWWGSIKGDKQSILAALEKIRAGGRLDKGEKVEQVKAFIIEALSDPSEGDPRVLLELGQRRSAYFLLQRKLDHGIDIYQEYPDDAERIYKLLEEAGANPDALVDVLPIEQAVAETPGIIASHAGEVPSSQRVIEQQLPGIDDIANRVTQAIEANWGKRAPKFTPGTSSAAVRDALRPIFKTAADRAAEARLVAPQVAEAGRKFTLLSYPEKRGIDLALAYVFPYQYWYTRTYMNWLKRLAYSPEVVASYAKYKHALAEVHAGAPDWWKYTVNSNELLGINSDNPLFFNLEQSINPLQGITGIDFTDQNKRDTSLGWLTSTLDDAGKFGASTWTPINWAVAAALKMKGEDDAAARWGSRLFPQTTALKSALSLFNINIPTGNGSVNEFDPMVHFFAGGTDPYERRRVGRAMGELVDEGRITAEQATDAVHSQSGPDWQMGVERAIHDRAGGNVASFFLGMGYKARNATDLQIDEFDAEYNKMWNMAPNMSKDEVRTAMDDLRNKYPWMDMVLLSRKSGLDRDRSYAYNILSRIPPAQSDNIADLVGIDPSMINKFYDDKGNISTWTEPDRQRFMAGMATVGAVLALPDSATRQGWNEAKTAYDKLKTDGTAMFGDDIWNQVDLYFAKKKVSSDEANAYLNAHPEVGQALDWQQAGIINNANLSQYYGGLKKIEGYYQGVMYDALHQKYGDISATWDEYYDLKLTSASQAKAFWNKHKELSAYMDDRDYWYKLISSMELSTADKLRAPEWGGLRPDYTPTATTQGLENYIQGTQQQLPPEYQYTWTDWKAQLKSEPLTRLVVDHFVGGKKLSAAAQSQIEFLANGMGMDPEMMLQLIDLSLEKEQQYAQ